MKRFRIVMLALVLVVLATGGVLYAKKRHPIIKNHKLVFATPVNITMNEISVSTSQSPTTPPSPAPTPGPNDPAITDVVFSTGVTSDQKPTHTTTTFSPTDPDIFIIVSLTHAKKSTILAYQRFYEGKFVSSTKTPLESDDQKTFVFHWKLQPHLIRQKGDYSVTFYTDGRQTKTASYTVK